MFEHVRFNRACGCRYRYYAPPRHFSGFTFFFFVFSTTILTICVFDARANSGCEKGVGGRLGDVAAFA